MDSTETSPSLPKYHKSVVYTSSPFNFFFPPRVFMHATIMEDNCLRASQEGGWRAAIVQLIGYPPDQYQIISWYLRLVGLSSQEMFHAHHTCARILMQRTVFSFQNALKYHDFLSTVLSTVIIKGFLHDICIIQWMNFRKFPFPPPLFPQDYKYARIWLEVDRWNLDRLYFNCSQPY